MEILQPLLVLLISSTAASQYPLRTDTTTMTPASLQDLHSEENVTAHQSGMPSFNDSAGGVTALTGDVSSLGSSDTTPADSGYNKSSPAAAGDSLFQGDMETSPDSSHCDTTASPEKEEQVSALPTNQNDTVDYGDDCNQNATSARGAGDGPTLHQTGGGDAVPSDPATFRADRSTTIKAPPSNGSGSGSDSGSDSDSDSIAETRKRMELAGLVPLAVVGVALNLLALWVWQADRTYNATTFLFKVLFDGPSQDILQTVYTG